MQQHRSRHGGQTMSAGDLLHDARLSQEVVIPSNEPTVLSFGEFTAQHDGTVEVDIHFTADTSGVTTNGYAFLRLLKNGEKEAIDDTPIQHNPRGPDFQSWSISKEVAVSPGDTLSVDAGHRAGGNISTAINEFNSWFQVEAGKTGGLLQGNLGLVGFAALGVGAGYVIHRYRK